MKPLKLTMNAFGPYRDKEVIDFTELKDNRLFVISGKTGAGKTTIFDAISFAIYGKASGEDRTDSRLLRSQFAEDNLFTSVDFMFELKNRVYRVFRQIGHVKVGNKTATGDKIELVEVLQDTEIPLIDRPIPTQVNEKLRELIGLNQDQFSQIVMLAQGEFRKLLMSDTENKEEILRRLFKTWMYKYVVDELDAKRREKGGDSQKLKGIRDAFIHQAQTTLPIREESILHEIFQQKTYNAHQILEALAVEIEHLNDQADDKAKAAKQATEALNKFREKLKIAEMLDKDFAELEEQQQTQIILNQQKSIMDEKAKLVQLAERAEKISPYESQYISSQTVAIEKARELAIIDAKQNAIQQTYVQVKADFDVHVGREDVRKAAHLKVAQLESFVPIVEGFEVSKSRLIKLTTEVEKLEQFAAKHTQDIDTFGTNIEVVNQAIKLKTEQLRELPELTLKASEINQQLDVLDDYLKLNQTLQSGQQTLLDRSNELKKLEGEVQELQAQMLHNQAGALAQHLTDGGACPVCGSHDHPAPATLTTDSPTKAEIDRKQALVLQANRTFAELEGQLKAEADRVEQVKAKLVEFGIQVERAEQAKLELQLRVNQISSKKRELDGENNTLLKLEQDRETLEIKLKQLQQDRDAIQTQLVDTKITHKEHETTHNKDLELVPSAYQDVSTLRLELVSAKQSRDELDQKWASIQQTYNEVNETRIKLESDYKNAVVARDESNTRFEQAKAQFFDMLNQAGFASVELYAQAKLSESERLLIAQEIERFNQKVVFVNSRILELTRLVDGKVREDVGNLRVEMAVVERYEDSLRTQSIEMKNKVDSAHAIFEQIQQAENEWQKANEQVQFIQTLFDVLKGENNKKISFERYLQMEFLDKILESANVRLSNMSAGQYYLVRSGRQEGNGRQSGLSFDVFDNYTGQYRDVKTLSGGEKFNASLCLALAMADVIQAYEGGVSLETMFIDEGFGHLDEESLTKAIDTLIDLQQTGRMIGVISHVPELKQAIPAILEVKKTPEGYSYTEFKVD